MSDEMNQGIAVPGEAAAPIVDTAAPVAEPSQNADTEARARAMGWAPKEEFRGPADKFVDAKTFVERAENETPILKENLRRLTDKITGLEARDREWRDTIRRVEASAQIALDRQRDQLVANYEAAKRNAVQNMDTASYDQLARDQQAALQQFDKTIVEHIPQQPQQRQMPADQQSAVDAFRRENAWFDIDPALNMAAQAIHIDLQRQKPGLSLSDNLREVGAEVRKRFPEKFGIQQSAPQQRQISQSAVEGGERVPVNSQPRRKGAGDLPTEARKAAESFIKQGLFKDMADYANAYWSQN